MLFKEGRYPELTIRQRVRRGLLLGTVMATLAGCGAASADNNIPGSGPASTPTPYPTETATPYSTATATPYPTGTAYPTATPSTYQGGNTPDVELQPGFCVQAPAESIVQGDVQVNGQPLYDNNPTTGLIVEMDQSGEVCAPWGADVQFVGKDNMASVLGTDAEQMKHPTEDMIRRGQLPCGSQNGCASVVIVKWPGN